MAESREKKMRRSLSNEFKMGRYWTRKIALKVAYLGGAYQGNTMGRETDEFADRTVEHQMVESMKKLRLVESFDQSGWSRCGRTDKGVSAWANVCTMIVRSDLRGEGALQCKDPGLVPPVVEDPGFKVKDCFEELDYVKAINKQLPSDIRIISWSPVAVDFDARKSARRRMYRYYFLQDGMNIENMRRGASFLVGTHDFRNFCEIDVANRSQWVRDFYTASVEPSDSSPGVFVAKFYASSFLWHQIRLIMSVLFHIGRGLEQPELVSELLDVTKNPSKPMFSMASDVPLVLYQCDFDEGALEWRGHDGAFNSFSLYTNLYKLYEDSAMKTSMLKDMVLAIQTPELEAQRRSQQHQQAKVYVPIMQRARQVNPMEKLVIWDKKKAAKEASKNALNGNNVNNDEDNDGIGD